MSSDTAHLEPSVDDAVSYRTGEGPCVVCMTSRPLDDDEPNYGTVRWELRRTGRLTVGVAVGFDCPNGHSSETDPALLKAFRRRVF